MGIRESCWWRHCRNDRRSTAPADKVRQVLFPGATPPLWNLTWRSAYLKGYSMAKKGFGIPKLTAMHYALLPPMILLAPRCEAYIGPGAGLTAIGSLVALVAAAF